jgi:hypothetical protein
VIVLSDDRQAREHSIAVSAAVYASVLTNPIIKPKFFRDGAYLISLEFALIHTDYFL